MVNPFNALYENEDGAQLQKTQTNSSSNILTQNPQKNTYRSFLRSNIQKILLLMVVIYLGVHIYNSMYCKEAFVTFQGENGQQDQKNLELEDQQQAFSVENQDRSQRQKKYSLQSQEILPTNLKQSLSKTVQQNNITPKGKESQIDSLDQKKQKAKLTNKDQHQEESGLLTKPAQTQQPQLPNFQAYKSQYQRFINSLKEETSETLRQKKELQINQIYSNLNDNHRFNIHAQTEQEFKHLVGSFISKKKSDDLPLRLTLQNRQFQSSMTDLDNQYHSSLQQRYSFENVKESQFCIILTTHNNAFNKQIIRSLNSIFSQQYGRYQVVIADRASTDSTYSLIHQYLQTFQSMVSKTTLIQTDQESEVYALRLAAQTCKPDTFAVYLDANTELVGKQVLKTLNSQFQQNKPNIIYGSYYELDVSKQKITLHNSQMYDESEVFMLLYRSLGSRTGKMISFKTNSVVNIPETYVKFNDKYFSYSGIQSLLVSLLQISCGRIRAVEVPLSLSLVDSQIQKKQERERKHELRQISSILKLDIC